MKRQEEEDDDDIVCLDQSFFINDDYELSTFTFGEQVLQFYFLQSALRQVVWRPGAMLMNDDLSKNSHIIKGSSIVELGSGVDNNCSFKGVYRRWSYYRSP